MECKYVFVPGGAFHRTTADCASAIASRADASYSDSAHALAVQGLVPCPDCCGDVLERYGELRRRRPVHETYDPDPEPEGEEES